jgi:hypothetical protein
MERKKLLTEIMEADAKDGLYEQPTAVSFLMERYKANGNKLSDKDFKTAKKIELDGQAVFFDSGVSEYARLFGPNPQPNEFEKD